MAPAPGSAAGAVAAANSAAEAARHAKRTGCLREAKGKKLLGSGRNSYIKECIAQ